MLAGVERQVIALRKPCQRNGQHVAIARIRPLTLVRTLELVVAEQEHPEPARRRRGAQLAPDPAVQSISVP